MNIIKAVLIAGISIAGCHLWLNRKDIFGSRYGLRRGAMIFLGVLLIFIFPAMHHPLAKVFQGMAWDRFSYTEAAILYDRFDAAAVRSFLNGWMSAGHKQPWLLHMTMSKAVADLVTRPAVQFAFVAASWNAPTELWRLSNAWETFLRAMQFIGFFAVLHVVSGRFLPSFVGSFLLTVGFWSQYMRDMNAWSAMASFALILMIISIAFSAIKSQNINFRERLILCYLGVVLLVVYPENGLVFSAIFVSLLLMSDAGRNLLGRRPADAIPYLVGAILLVVGVKGWLAFVLRQIRFASGFSEGTVLARLLRPLVNDGDGDLSIISSAASNAPDFLALLVDRAPWVIINIFGSGYISRNWTDLFVNLFAMLLVVFVLVLCAKKHRENFGIFLIVLAAVYWAVQCALFAKGSVYGSARLVAYGPLFLSLGIACLALRSSRRVAIGAAVIFGFGNLSYAAQYQISAMKGAPLDFGSFSRGYAVEHLSSEGRVYTYDMRTIRRDLKLCQMVYIDLGSYWHQAFLIQYFDNNGIRYRSRLPYMTASYGGDVYYPGFQFQEGAYDCVVYERTNGNFVDYALRRIVLIP